MSEGTVIIESQASPEVQKAALEMGWQPPERYKGTPDTFVDAEEYIKKTETVLPIVRETNRRLREELRSVSEQTRATQAALAAAQEAIKDMQAEHSVATARAIEQAKAEVKAQLAAASEAGDHKGVADLTEQLVQLNETKAEEKKAAPPPPLPAPEIDPAAKAFIEDNPWWGVDKRKTSLFLGIATELDEKIKLGEIEPMDKKQLYAKVLEELETVFPPAGRPASKVEGGSGNGGPPARDGGYTSLPADAKVQCDKDAKRFVGEGKRYKTVADWRKVFVERYNQA
jgi:hypothetical protein